MKISTLCFQAMLLSSLAFCLNSKADEDPCNTLTTLPRTFKLDLLSNGMDDTHYQGVITLNAAYTPFFTPDSFIQDSKGNMHEFDLKTSGCNGGTIVLAWYEDTHPSPRIFYGQLPPNAVGGPSFPLQGSDGEGGGIIYNMTITS
jgi:hypothetical protein